MALTLNGTTGLSGIVGSAGTPALQGGDTNTGYFFGTDILGLSTGGTSRLYITSDGKVGIGTTSPTELLDVEGTIECLNELRSKTGNDLKLNAGSANRDVFLQVNDSTLMTVQGSTGNVGIGRTDPGHRLAILGGASSQLEVKGTEADIWLNSTGPSGVWRILGSTGGNTHRFRIYDNTNGKEPFYIIGSSGTNTQHVHINSGDLVFDAAGTGINFAATADGTGSSINETLSDYEQGEWTPSITSGGWTSFGASVSGHYTKVGNIVHVSMANGVLTGSGDGTTLKISGLPFTASAWTPGSMYAEVYNSEGTDQATIAAQGSGTELRVVEWGVEAQGNDFGAGYFVVQVSYRVA